MRLLLFIIISTLVFAYDVTLINHCKGLKVTKIELAKHNPYGDKEVVGIQYGLKNTTNQNIDGIKISVYLKDKDGHRIYEDNFHAGNLKPFYEKPFDPSRYYAIGNAIPSSFGGKADVVIYCKKVSKSNTTKQYTIKIPEETYRALTKNQPMPDMYFKMNMMLLLNLIEKNDGFKKFYDKITPCMKR